MIHVAGRGRSIDPLDLDKQSLRVWASHGVGPKFLHTLRPPVRKHLMTDIFNTSRMLLNNFPATRLQELSPDVPMSFYAEGWEHGVQPAELTRVKNVNGLQLSQVDSTTQKSIPGELGPYLSSRIAGASQDQAQEAINIVRHYPDPETGRLPLHLYSRFLTAPGTQHEEFVAAHGAIQKALKEAHPGEYLSHYVKYREAGMGHDSSMDSLKRFTAVRKDGMHTLRDDSNFLTALSRGSSSSYYWQAHDQGHNMKVYTDALEHHDPDRAFRMSRPQNGPDVDLGDLHL